jgi:Tfp pilus assembly protein PilN
MKTAINLLPISLRRQTLVRRRSVQWCTVLCVVMLSIWGARWFKMRELRVLNQQLEAVSREGRPAQAMLQEVTEMRRQIQMLQHHESVARELERQRHVISLLGLVSRAAAQSAGKLRVTKLQAVDMQSSYADSASKAGQTLSGTVTLTGLSLDSPAVAEFHDALLKSGLFVDVRLIKSNEQTLSGVRLYDYEVSCEL